MRRQQSDPRLSQLGSCRLAHTMAQPLDASDMAAWCKVPALENSVCLQQHGLLDEGKVLALGGTVLRHATSEGVRGLPLIAAQLLEVFSQPVVQSAAAEWLLQCLMTGLGGPNEVLLDGSACHG